MTTIQTIGKDTLIGQAKEVFDNAISSSNSGLRNPSKIKEEITHLKHFSSKLKFQYLEQETRDKFLRLLLIDEKSISEEDIDNIVGENGQLKESLKQLKREIEALTEQAENVAEEVIRLNEKLAKEKEEAQKGLDEAAQLQKELDLLMEESENEHYKTLFHFKKLIDSDDIGLSEAISIANSAVESDEAALKEVRDKLEKAKKELAEKKSQEEELRRRASDLKIQVEDGETQVLKGEQQEYAQKLGDIKGLLSRFEGNILV